MPPAKPDPVVVARIVTVGAWVAVICGGLLAASAVVLLAFVYVMFQRPGASLTQPFMLLGGMGVLGTFALIRGLGRLRHLRQGLPVG